MWSTHILSKVVFGFHTSTVLTTNLLVQYHLAIKTGTKMLYFEKVTLLINNPNNSSGPDIEDL